MSREKGLPASGTQLPHPVSAQAGSPCLGQKSETSLPSHESVLGKVNTTAVLAPTQVLAGTLLQVL